MLKKRRKRRNKTSKQLIEALYLDLEDIIQKERKRLTMQDKYTGQKKRKKKKDFEFVVVVVRLFVVLLLLFNETHHGSWRCYCVVIRLHIIDLSLPLCLIMCLMIHSIIFLVNVSQRRIEQHHNFALCVVFNVNLRCIIIFLFSLFTFLVIDI